MLIKIPEGGVSIYFLVREIIKKEGNVKFSKFIFPLENCMRLNFV